MGNRLLGYVLIVGPALHAVAKAMGVTQTALGSGYGYGSLIGGWIGSLIGILFGLAVVMRSEE